jgi:hypothetical protein
MSHLTGFALSEAQLRWLDSNNLLPSDLMNHLQSAMAGGASNFRLPSDIVDAICDVLTLALAEIGFDGDEKLTSDGEKLEALIAQFTRFD